MANHATPVPARAQLLATTTDPDARLDPVPLLLAVGYGHGEPIKTLRPRWHTRASPWREARFWRRTPTTLMLRLIPAGQPRGARWYRVYADLTAPGSRPSLYVLHRRRPHPLPESLAVRIGTRPARGDVAIRRPA